jgi:hypothetical protein
MGKKINKENLEAIGFHLDDKITAMFKANIEYPHYEYYVSHNRRYILQSNCNNLPINGEWGWNLHVDNSDMCSIASCDVEYIEQIQAIMEIYKDY